MNKVAKFFHQLRYPHCPECLRENAPKDCISCDMLRGLLEDERRHNKILIEQIINLSSPEKTDPPVPQVDLDDLKKTIHLPWKVRQAQLEADDRKVAQILREKKLAQNEIPDAAKAEIEKLENQLGLTEVTLDGNL